MNKKITAIITTILLAATCITSVSAVACRTCGETMDELGCTMPNIPNMSNSVDVNCTEHTGCKKVYYYADTITYCPVCQESSEGVTTHQCAVGHRWINEAECYKVESVCKFW